MERIPLAVPAGRRYDPSKLTDARARAHATPDDSHSCRLPLRIIVVPSWFPSPRAPLAGIFFAEQTELLAKHAPTIEVHVFAVPRRDLRDPLQATGRRAAHAAPLVARHQSRDARRHAELRRSHVRDHRLERSCGTRRTAARGAADGPRRARDRARTRAVRSGARAREPPGRIRGGRAGTDPRRAARRLRAHEPLPIRRHARHGRRPFPDVLSPLESAARVTAVSRAHAASIAQWIDRRSTSFRTSSTRRGSRRAARRRAVPLSQCRPSGAAEGLHVLLRALALCHARGDRYHLTDRRQGPSGGRAACDRARSTWSRASPGSARPSVRRWPGSTARPTHLCWRAGTRLRRGGDRGAGVRVPGRGHALRRPRGDRRAGGRRGPAPVEDPAALADAMSRVAGRASSAPRSTLFRVDVRVVGRGAATGAAATAKRSRRVKPDGAPA